MWVRIPSRSVAVLVSLNKTLNHNCFVLRMGRKVVGPVCCVMHVKEPRTLIVKEKGLALVFLDSRLEHPAGWICIIPYYYYYYYYSIIYRCSLYTMADQQSTASDLRCGGGMVGLCVKRSPLTNVTLVRTRLRPYVSRVVRWFSAVPRGFFSGPSGFPPSGKIRHFRSQAVLRGHNGLMWLAAKGALACLLLEHVVATSFAIQLQLRVRMISLPNYYYYYYYYGWVVRMWLWAPGPYTSQEVENDPGMILKVARWRG